MRSLRESLLHGWPQEAVGELRVDNSTGRRTLQRTEPFGSQTAFCVLRKHCGFIHFLKSANCGLKASGLLGVLAYDDSTKQACQWGGEVYKTVNLIEEPDPSVLQTIGALQSRTLKEMRAELTAAYGMVDGLAGLVEHLMLLHGGKYFDAEKFKKAIWGKRGDDETPEHALRLVQDAGPICGTLYVGWPNFPTRLHIALPQMHTLTDRIEPGDRETRDLILGVSGERDDRRSQRLDMYSTRHLEHVEPLVPLVPLQLRAPAEVQVMLNECVLALLAYRSGLRAATPLQIAKAAARFALPSSSAEAFRRLADPDGVGLRARRWQRRRPLLLLRSRGHAVLSQVPLEVFQHICTFA